MRKTLGFLTMTACLFAAPSEKDRREAADRLKDATEVLASMTHAGDSDIPQDLLDKAQCTVIVPGLKKGAFIIGGQFGKGFITCRGKGDRGWTTPAAIKIEGGSVGFQIGGSETDVIMLVMNQKGAERLMQSQFTVGGEGEVAAGPVGRNASAQTDAKLTAEMLSWSRSRGVFAGVSLKGTTLRSDKGENEVLYGRGLDTRDIVNGNVSPTPAGQQLISALTKESPAEKH
ncbi:MAG: lipid-binding SYLF domain-containing protein [Acidobacteriota bacterium]